MALRVSSSYSNSIFWVSLYASISDRRHARTVKSHAIAIPFETTGNVTEGKPKTYQREWLRGKELNVTLVFI